MRRIALLATLVTACDVPPLDTRDLHDDTGTIDTADTDDTDDTDPSPYDGPVVYPASRTHSPLTPHVVRTMRDIAATGSGLQADVFMKIGASSTVSDNTLSCFADDPIELGSHTALRPTLDFFLAGDAAGATPFDRDTLAAKSGRSAGWCISGDPSPLEQEIDAISPQYAVVHYGTNDMQLGTSYFSALPGFYDAEMELVAQLVEQGIVPIVVGITERTDIASATEWVPTYNAVIRGIAQAWQVPHLDLYDATVDLDDYGLSGDGLHLEAYPGGACVLTEDGLEHGYNARNLVVLQALDRVVEVMERGEDALDSAIAPPPGDGSASAPFPIGTLPWTDYRDTAASPHSALDTYTGCASDADESGPEWLYRYEVTATTRIRALVLDQGDVDIDVHLLDATASESGCLLRGHRMVEATLTPGTYHFALDTWVDGGGTEHDGDYLFTILECHPEDGACATPTF